MNITKGGDGLVLKVEDMMKIGRIMLQKGIYINRKIVSSEWIQTITNPYNLTYDHIGITDYTGG